MADSPWAGLERRSPSLVAQDAAPAAAQKKGHRLWGSHRRSYSFGSSARGNVVSRDAIRRFIRETMLFGDETVDLHDDVPLLDEGIIDSIGVVELVGFVEAEFGIAVAGDELIPTNFDSIRSLAALVDRKLGEHART